MTAPTTPNRQCPNCGKPVTPGLPCRACGFDPRAGVIRRDTPEQARGLNAVAMKFGVKWSFGAALLMVGGALIYYDDISGVEQSGGTFSADPFTGMLYEAFGMWAAVGFWLLCAVFFVIAGFRALSLKRAGQLE